MRKLNINVGDFLFRWVAPLLVLGCAGWFVFAMGAQNKPKRKKAPVRKSIPVEVVQAKLHDGTLDIVSRGVVIPHREVKLSARVAGEVVFKSDLLSPGQFVNKDELLIRVDPTDYKLEVARLKQELAKVDADLDRIKVDRSNAERLLKINRDVVILRKADDSRFSRLRSANAASDTEVDAAQLSMLTAIEKVTVAENQIRGFDSQANSLIATRELATIELQRASLDLSRTEIYAPFSGVVIENHVEQNSNIANGAMVATIEDTSKAEVRCNLRSDEMEFIYDSAPVTPTAQVNSVNPDAAVPSAEPDPASAYELPPVPVTIEYERAGQIFQWDGVLSRQDGLGVDQNTRTMPVRILVNNPTGSSSPSRKPSADSDLLDKNKTSVESSPPRALAIVRGMFVKVRLHCQPRMPLMVIPESVLRPGKNVWIMRSEQLHIEPVRITRIEGGQAYFDPRRSSLFSSDQIISSPVPNAKQGLAVTLKSTGKGKGKGKSKEAPSSEVKQNGKEKGEMETSALQFFQRKVAKPQGRQENSLVYANSKQSSFIRSVAHSLLFTPQFRTSSLASLRLSVFAFQNEPVSASAIGHNHGWCQ